MRLVGTPCCETVVKVCCLSQAMNSRSHTFVLAEPNAFIYNGVKVPRKSARPSGGITVPQRLPNLGIQAVRASSTKQELRNERTTNEKQTVGNNNFPATRQHDSVHARVKMLQTVFEKDAHCAHTKFKALLMILTSSSPSVILGSRKGAWAVSSSSSNCSAFLFWKRKRRTISKQSQNS